MDAFDPQNYPSTAGLKEPSRLRFAKLLQTLREYAEGQPFAASHLKDVRGSIGRVFEDTWELHVREPLRKLSWQERDHPDSLSDAQMWLARRDVAPDSGLGMIVMGIHQIGSLGKKLAKDAAASPYSDSLAFVEQAQSVVREWQPLADALEDLKNKSVARGKAPVERAPAYEPPPATIEAERRVREVLTAITEEHREGLRLALCDFYTRTSAGFVQREKERVQTLQDQIAQGIRPHKDAYRIQIPGHFLGMKGLLREVGDPAFKHSMRDPTRHMVLSNKAAEVIENYARREAEDCQRTFVEKNLAKLVSIIDKKPFVCVEAVDHGFDLHGIRGRLKVRFEDGSSFEANNSVVRSHSPLGTPFLRFPLTFHNVRLPDGSKLPQPSEERMNTVFLRVQEDDASDEAPQAPAAEQPPRADLTT